MSTTNKMQVHQAITLLKRHNIWRRGDDVVECSAKDYQKKLGEAIDLLTFTVEEVTVRCNASDAQLRLTCGELSTNELRLVRAVFGSIKAVL